MSTIGISITKNAWSKIKHIIQISHNNLGFIFSASSGGCNGFNFNLKLLDQQTFNEINKNKLKPTIIQNNNTKLYIDPLSELYLIGSTIDYIEEDYSKGEFENKFIFNVNKDLATSCGCGVSFTPK
jgi:iron-sulfur cluster assembly protein